MTLLLPDRLLQKVRLVQELIRLKRMGAEGALVIVFRQPKTVQMVGLAVVLDLYTEALLMLGRLVAGIRLLPHLPEETERLLIHNKEEVVGLLTEFLVLVMRLVVVAGLMQQLEPEVMHKQLPHTMVVPVEREQLQP